MVQRRQDAGFSLEANQPLRVRCECRRQDFERNVASESGVECPVHVTHSARTHEAADLERAETLANEVRRV